jgi:mono/diheme cytochrome c family protein
MRRLLAVSAAVLLATAAVQAGEKEDREQIGLGRAFFINNCASCHGPLAQGTAGGSHRLDLTSIAEHYGGRFDEVAVFQVVYGAHQVPLNGHRDMPVWGRMIARDHDRGDGLARARCADLVAYLKYIQDHPPVMVVLE